MPVIKKNTNNVVKRITTLLREKRSGVLTANPVNLGSRGFMNHRITTERAGNQNGETHKDHTEHS